MKTGHPLNPALLEQVNDYLLSLQDVNEVSKGNYGACFKSFVLYLENRGIKRFEDVSKTVLGQFLSTKGSQNTKNLYIFVIKNFYKNYLDKSDLVENLHQKPAEETITPSELLTLEEVVSLANDAGKRKDVNRVIILTLFESCARINELLRLKLGDVLFSSVVTKEGNRKLIATLHFKRSKGNVKKQPVVLSMFASELKSACTGLTTCTINFVGVQGSFLTSHFSTNKLFNSDNFFVLIPFILLRASYVFKNLFR